MTDQQYAKAKRLYNYKNIIQLIKKDERELEVWKTKLIGIGAQNIDGLPKATKKDDRKIDIIEKKKEIIERLAREREKLLEEELRIREAIQKVEDPRLQLILRIKYMEGRSNRETADLMHCAERTMCYWSLEALDAIEID